MSTGSKRTEGVTIDLEPKVYEFDAVIQKVEDQDGAYVAVPIDIRAEFGKGRITSPPLQVVV